MGAGLIIHYSAIDAFLACPAAYKRRYIDGIKDEQESSALHGGTALHLAIKAHFEGMNAEETYLMYWNSVKNLDMIYYRHSWEDLRNLGLSWLNKFTKLHARKYSEGKMEEYCEMPLFFDDQFDNGQIFLGGTFDRCSEYDNVLTMTDWKTSSKEYKKNKIDKNPQLYIYSAMYRHNYGVLPKQIQYKVFRKDNGGIQTLTQELSEDKLKQQLDNVTSVIKMMLNSKANNLYPHTFECYCKE
jgi:hypothetical protein